MTDETSPAFADAPAAAAEPPDETSPAAADAPAAAVEPPDETSPVAADAPAATAEPPQAPATPAGSPVGKRPSLQPRMKATGQRRSKERGAHTHHKKNPGKRPKKGGS